MGVRMIPGSIAANDEFRLAIAVATSAFRVPAHRIFTVGMPQ
jgi:hypothetical protein